ncbi:ATP synthase F1 subunit epsilon [Christensenella timonensis]|uniref:ATP synthase F1 subunit epsilon n=1 Tax=Christensenella timonensis TaxID=1816678 RepID=UPI0008379FDC|nr:ATP synthase F1 subunit epsilon [Christensenella timonensis]
MAAEFLVEILTPERSFFCDNVQSIIFPTEDGQMSIQKGHESEVVTVVPGEVKINTGKKWLICSVAEGFLEVRPDETIMFTQAAEWPEEIDVKRAERAKERAEERMRQRMSAEEYRRSKIALARAMARLSLTKRKTTL